MKILMLCHKMPFPLTDGGSHAIYHNALGFIQNNISIKLLALNTPKDWVDVSDLPEEFIEKTNFECITIDTRIKPWNALINLFSGKSYFVERFWSELFEKKLLQILSEEKFDVIQLEHLYMCLYLPAIRKNSKAKVVLRSQNVEHMLRKRYMSNNKNIFSGIFLKIATNRLMIFEKTAVNKVDGIIALTSEDEAAFQIMAKKTPITVIPLGYDLSKINHINRTGFDNLHSIYHLGSMDWLPNVQGVDWFIKEILPLLVKKHPEIQFRIAGKKMPSRYYDIADKNLIVDGEIKDAIEYQSKMSVMIVPLLSGGGIRVKIIEGLALGKTIISTTIGAEGIPAAHNKNILIADTPEEFVKQISRCILSPELCFEIGKKGRELAMSEFHHGDISKKVLRFFKQL